MLEDSAVDAEIIQKFLLKRDPNCEFKVVMTEEGYLRALDQFQPDLILSDNTMPRFSATEALKLFNQRSLPIPFILVTGTVSEEFAAGIIRSGADDYILKDRLSRLPAAMDAAIKRKAAEENLRSLEKKILEQKIQEQKKIARAIIKAQERERNHIGQELHDNINQILAGAKMYLGIAMKKNDEIKELVRYPMELIDSSIEAIRSLSRMEVTPLKNIDLEELVRELLLDLGQHNTIKPGLTYSVSNELLSDDLKLNIYRIIQEQLSNIIKHADAKNITISVKTEGKDISIIITDDGKGFNVKIKRKGIGISNMINRVESYNGKIMIKSNPGEGCKVSVKFPADDSERRRRS